MTALNVMISILTNYIPFIRKVPIDVNRKFSKSIQIIERVSKKLIEERCNEADNDKLKREDLLSLLIGINKTLPTEEKMTDDELKYQVI
jgi:cytochrome P450